MTVSICVFLLLINVAMKREKISYTTSLVVMWVIMTFISGNADESIYLSRYNNASDWATNSELLFQALNVMGNKLGLSFLQFRGCIAFLYIALIGSTIWKLSKYPNLVLVLFFFCPFPLNVTQLRFGLSSAIFIYSYRYFITDENKDNNKKFFLKSNEVKFCICVVLATLIHTVALCWLSLLVVKKISLKQTIFLTVIANLFVYFLFNPSSIYWLLTKIGAFTRMAAYFSMEYQKSSYRHYGMTFLTSVLISSICIIACILSGKKKKYEVDLLLKSNIFSITVLAFILRFTSEMYRPQEGIMLLNYIVLTNECTGFRLKCKRKEFDIQVLLVILVAISFIMKIYLYNRCAVWNPMFF